MEQKITQDISISNNEIKFSIIIPVYNTPKEYIRQCLDSIINQSYKDWECVFVDNGSDIDYSNFLIDERITYTRIEHNVGIFLAYKHGFDISKGEYIIYCDSDDWLHEDYLQQVVLHLNPQYDTYLMNVVSVFKDGYKEKAIWANKGIQDYRGDEWFEALCSRKKTSWALWGVTLNRDVLQKSYNALTNIKEHIVGPHDLLLMMVYSFFSKDVKYIPFEGFYYRITSNSASRSGVTIEKLQKMIKDDRIVFDSLNVLLKNNGIELSKLDKIKQESGNSFIEAFYRLELYDSQFEGEVFDVYGIELIKPKKTIQNMLLPKDSLQYRFMRFLIIKIYKIRGCTR